jgi:hypothetical protein
MFYTKFIRNRHTHRRIDIQTPATCDNNKKEGLVY